MESTRRLISIAFALVGVTSFAHAGILRQGKPLLLCHRTANRDLPENTLESLALAARMGCDIIEVDVTRTLDGELVLNHDTFLDRFTNTTGDVERTELRELDRMDFGGWRGERFRGMRIAHLDDALRLAREMKVGLYLDIKSKGIGPKILAALAQEGMTERVIFGGEWDDVKALDARANPDPVGDLQPGFSRDAVESLHVRGKVAIANFIYNGHETDLPAMRAAIRDGADGIMVDYPRLGAEALGRPVEARLGEIAKHADKGDIAQRVAAIRELSQYTGFPLEGRFLRWIEDPDDAVSHEAALALVMSRPRVKPEALQPAVHATAATARRNAAWAIGTIASDTSDTAHCIPLLLPMLDDRESSVAKQALLALTWCPVSTTATVPAEKLLPLLADRVPIVRGLAAVALAKFQPQIAAELICKQIQKEEAEAARYDSAWAARGRAKLTQPEIDQLVELYRAQMKYIQALSMLPEREALGPLVAQAFRSVHDYSNVTALVAGYQLWDRIADAPESAIKALAASDVDVADRAEWALVEAGPSVLPAVRSALEASPESARRRLIEILAWQADKDAVPTLERLEKSDAPDRELIRWAIAKILSLGA